MERIERLVDRWEPYFWMAVSVLFILGAMALILLRHYYGGIMSLVVGLMSIYLVKLLWEDQDRISAIEIRLQANAELGRCNEILKTAEDEHDAAGQLLDEVKLKIEEFRQMSDAACETIEAKQAKSSESVGCLAQSVSI